MSEKTDQNQDQGEQQGARPTLVPPEAAKSGEEKSQVKLLAIIGIGTLLVALALIVLFLPLATETRTANVTTTPPAQPTTRSTPIQQNGARPGNGAAEGVEKLIGTWLLKQAEAEAERVREWGGEAYVSAVSRAQDCDRLLGEQSFLPASEACEAAINALDKLMAEKQEILEEALLAGELALEEGQLETATELFQRGLAIEAGNERALNGIKRVEQRPEVLRLLAEGTALQHSGDQEGARRAFKAAVDLDPAFAPAQQALVRVGTSIAEREFQQAMSQALQALSQGRLSTAGQALQQAGAIRPGDPAVNDLKLQLAQRRQTGKLNELRNESERLEQAERWTEALKVCEDAFSLDPQVSFAAACKERVRQRIELDNRLQGFLSRPERLFEEDPLNEARQLLAFATTIKPRGPQLAARIDRLTGLVVEAETEVDVVLESDGLTEVSIYHVGRLGRFTEKRLRLRTGNYTATGSRDGYRDIRQTLKIRPSAGALVFALRCEDTI